MWSFVMSKDTMDLVLTLKLIVGVYIGSRNASDAKDLWDSLSPVYRQCAVIFTDSHFHGNMLLEIIWCFQRNVTNRLKKKLVLQIVLNARAMRQRISRYYNTNII